MGEPESIHDRRDVVGTLAPSVVVPRALAERALVALRASMTRGGHLAQRVTHENLGFCSWRSESERCMEQRRLIDELNAALVEGV